MKKLYYLILPVITLLFGFIFTFNTYAVDDFVFNIDSSSTFPLTLCSSPGSNDYPMCSDYTFVKVEPVYSVTPSNINNSYFSISGLYGTRVPTFIDSYYEINEFVTGLSISSWSSNLTSLKITFTNSVSASCPEPDPCPEPEPCDCDDAFIVGLFKDSFWQVATAIVALIVPILALFLLFRLVHGLMFGKGI